MVYLEVLKRVGSTDEALRLTGGKGVLVLGMSRKGSAVEIDLYNSSRRRRAVQLTGPLSRGKRVCQADMLGRTRSAGAIVAEPLTYTKLLVRPRGSRRR